MGFIKEIRLRRPRRAIARPPSAPVKKIMVSESSRHLADAFGLNAIAVARWMRTRKETVTTTTLNKRILYLAFTRQPKKAADYIVHQQKAKRTRFTRMLLPMVGKAALAAFGIPVI